jgi:glycosyltransferase involved in cell wall biosynthesis
MRVALLSQRASMWGGIERVVRDTALGLRERGHHVRLYHDEMSPDATYAEAFDHVEGLGSRDLLHAAAEIAREADLVYVHKWEDPTLVEHLLERVPLLVMVHDHDLTCPRRHRYTLFGRRPCTRPMGAGCAPCLPILERVPGQRRIRYRPWTPRGRWLRLARRIPRLLVGSPAMAELLEINGIRSDQITTIPPVPRGHVSPTPPPYPNAGYILGVGQLIRTKGWDLLLEAYEGLHAPPRLLIAGTGNEAARLAERANASRHHDRIQFLGWTPPEELSALYRGAAVVAVPSRWQEPFGLVGLEAMAQARPVVGFAVGGIPAWLENERTGLLAEPEDVLGLRTGIARLLADPQLAAEFGRAGHEARRVRFDHQAQMGGIERLLLSLTGRRTLEPTS